MNDNQILSLLIDLKGLVAGISATLETTKENQAKMNELLLHHEQRLTKIETGSGTAGMKDQLIALLIKGLVTGMIAVASLTGAGAALKGIWQ